MLQTISPDSFIQTFHFKRNIRLQMLHQNERADKNTSQSPIYLLNVERGNLYADDNKLIERSSSVTTFANLFGPCERVCANISFNNHS